MKDFGPLSYFLILRYHQALRGIIYLNPSFPVHTFKTQQIFRILYICESTNKLIDGSKGASAEAGNTR